MRQRIIDDDKLVELMESGKTQKQAAAFFGVSPVSICKRLKKLGYEMKAKDAMPESVTTLTENRKRFVTGDGRTEAAIKTQDVTTRESARTTGSFLMKFDDVQAAIRDIFESISVPPIYKAQRLKYCADKQNPSDVIKAIQKINRIDGTYQEQINIPRGELFVRVVQAADELHKRQGDKQQKANEKIIDITVEQEPTEQEPVDDGMGN